MTDRGASTDLADVASLIRAGEELNLSPRPGEEPLAFAVRVAERLDDRKRRPGLALAARLAASVALAAFGVASF